MSTSRLLPTGNCAMPTAVCVSHRGLAIRIARFINNGGPQGLQCGDTKEDLCDAASGEETIR